MEETTTPHFWSGLNYNFLPAILTQGVNYTEIILLHILEAGVCFIKCISPAFSLGHISRCGQKRTVFSSSLSHLSLPPISFALPSPHSCSRAPALTHVFTHLLFHSHFSCSLSLLLIFTSLLSSFLFPFPTLPCLNFPRWNFSHILWKLDANNEFSDNSRHIRAHKNNSIELCINAQSWKLRKCHCSCKNFVLYI